jgi:hypothetical protein
METPNTSPIQIQSISLIGLNFEILKSNPSDISIHIDNLSIEVSTDEKSSVVIVSTVNLKVQPNEAHPIAFTAHLTYEIESRVEKQDDVKHLKAFARIGAPFNALVHAREVIVGLTSRAFGKSVLIPLLDIQKFGDAISFVEPEKPADV